ncbi:hypothetical protein FOMPIDRAFT_1127448 [Fomitopsis schrenkii]|uniref:Uncharacterized protein n=1 Tax=Fomitopsis schrenkii TaxID=2126942 RepID=S8DZL6_FOMSC|nr:hypothetical protein FOMPIDRAFT_1127448 [Fomitopsis schrenkii]
MTTKLISHALGTFNSATKARNWIGCLKPDEYPEHVPQFFSRADVTDEQRVAVLILLHSFAQSEKLAHELASECLIEHTIIRLFGPLHHYWIYSATIRDIDRDQPLLAVFLSGGPDAVEKDIDIARRYMARRLHSTLTLLATRHCQAHGWGTDHTFTKADAELPINKRFFAFSVFFARRVFQVDINFPAIKLSEDKSTYIWTFVNGPVMQTEYSHPLTIVARLTIFQALLFIEQHIHLLLEELDLEDGFEATLSR